MVNLWYSPVGYQSQPSVKLSELHFQFLVIHLIFNIKKTHIMDFRYVYKFRYIL